MSGYIQFLLKLQSVPQDCIDYNRDILTYRHAPVSKVIYLSSVEHIAFHFPTGWQIFPLGALYAQQIDKGYIGFATPLRTEAHCCQYTGNIQWQLSLP